MKRDEKMRKLISTILVAGVVFLFCGASLCLANNLQISDATIISDISEPNVATVKFNMSWDNSWRTEDPPYNYDAVWVFVKFKPHDRDRWYHAYLSPIEEDHTVEGDFDVKVGRTIVSTVSKGIGAFVQRNSSNVSGGTVAPEGIELKWILNANQAYSQVENVLSHPDMLVKVMGIEMVYIPKGRFYCGGAMADSTFSTLGGGVGAWHITGEDSIQANLSNPSLPFYYENAGFGYGILPAYPQYERRNLNFMNENQANPTPGGRSVCADPCNPGGLNTDSPWFFTIPDNFPKGYDAFYVMKYEVTEGQYADFLNMIGTYATDRHYGYSTNNWDPDTWYTLEQISPTEYYAHEPDRANRVMSWYDTLSYLDWAGLRLPSEFEYEKAARGGVYEDESGVEWGVAPYPDLANIELAWGVEDILWAEEVSSGTIGDGLGEYTVSNPAGYANVRGNTANWWWNPPSVLDGHGALRAGVFAASGSGSSRVQAGASYYGAMEMTGNVNEPIVAVGAKKACVCNENSENSPDPDALALEYSGKQHGDGEYQNYNWPSTWPDTEFVAWGNTYVGGMGWRGGTYATWHINHLSVAGRDLFFNYNVASALNKSGCGARGVRRSPQYFDEE